MTRVPVVIIASALVAACTSDIPAADQPIADTTPSASAAAPADRIQIGMSGAPAGIASAATIMDFDASGNLIELQPGTNGWLCIVDDTPAAPGDSPDCLDPTWQKWFDAYMKKETPMISGVGVAYMLQGGLSPSNTDPFAETPPPGMPWMEDGPHVMLIVPDPKLLDAFPAEHTNGGPYVMYRGTPYAHLMMPVAGH
jgi:hypothetical protein